MVKSPKSGRELGGQHIDKAPPLLRKLYDKLGVTPSHRAGRDDAGDDR